MATRSSSRNKQIKPASTERFILITISVVVMIGLVVLFIKQGRDNNKKADSDYTLGADNAPHPDQGRTLGPDNAPLPAPESDTLTGPPQ